MKKQRPNAWTFIDPVQHKLHEWSMRARAQAWYRGEEWTLTDQEYIDLWTANDNYKLRGRSNHHLCMTRIDPDGAWSLDNVHIITREQHYKTCNNFKGGWAALRQREQKNNV